MDLLRGTLKNKTIAELADGEINPGQISLFDNIVLQSVYYDNETNTRLEGYQPDFSNWDNDIKSLMSIKQVEDYLKYIEEVEEEKEKEKKLNEILNPLDLFPNAPAMKLVLDVFNSCGNKERFLKINGRSYSCKNEDERCYMARCP